MGLVPVVGVLVIAAAATLADFIWYSNGVRHTMLAGSIYGALLLTLVGAVLGAAHHRILKGLPLGFIAGIAGALSYYALILVMDSRTYGSAIPGAWVIMWLLLAGLEARWLQSPLPRSWTAALIRGGMAAVLGGLAFAAVRDVLWGRPAGAERNYLLQFAAWAIAWAPGILSLTWRTGGGGANEIDPRALAERLGRGERLPILDVRSEAEFAAGHVPGAANIPFTLIASRLSAVPPHGDEPLYLYCGHGPRAYLAGRALRRHGHHRIVYLAGHFAAWQLAGLPVERSGANDVSGPARR